LNVGKFHGHICQIISEAAIFDKRSNQ
jgi:hypothetical protein